MKTYMFIGDQGRSWANLRDIDGKVVHPRQNGDTFTVDDDVVVTPHPDLVLCDDSPSANMGSTGGGVAGAVTPPPAQEIPVSAPGASPVDAGQAETGPDSTPPAPVVPTA